MGPRRRIQPGGASSRASVGCSEYRGDLIMNFPGRLSGVRHPVRIDDAAERVLTIYRQSGDPMLSRRRVLALSAALPLSGTATIQAAEPAPAESAPLSETISLNGPWAFCLDPRNDGLAGKWYEPDAAAPTWRQVTVPHTWQIEPENTSYMGVGWYRRSFDAPAGWADRAVRIEFEAVFHTATVW